MNTSSLPVRVWHGAACILLLPLVMLCAGCESSGSNLSYSGSSHADAKFQSASNSKPIPETLYAVARILVSQGRDNEAEPVLQRLVAEHPNFVPAYCELAELQMRGRRLGDAVETLSAGLEVAQEEPSLLNNVGMCWMLRDQHEKALEYFARAAALAPDDARYRSNMAAALGMQGRYDESLAVYQQVVSPAEAHYNLGVLAEAREDFEHATIHFTTAQELNPKLQRKPR